MKDRGRCDDPATAGMRPIDLPKVNIEPFKVPPIPTVESVVKYHKQCSRDINVIIKGSQWPTSLKEFCKPWEAEHQFYAWVLSLAL